MKPNNFLASYMKFIYIAICMYVDMYVVAIHL